MVPLKVAFRSLVVKYLDEFQDMYDTARKTGQTTPELSFRPALHTFFKNLPAVIERDNIGIIFEPRKQLQSGRPDWRFHDTNSMAVYGYAEAKGFLPNRYIDRASSIAGVTKYVSLGHRIILTDGIDFAFFHPASPQVPKIVSLLPKPVPDSGRWHDFANVDILPMFLDFFRTPTARRVSLNDLTKEMALRAKLISEDVLEVVSLEMGSGIDKEENATIEALRGLKELLEKGHDPDLCDNAKFADMVSQVLAFGLMYAYWQLVPSVHDSKQLASNLERFWVEPVESAWTIGMRPFKALVESITRSSWQLGPLKTWYSDCILHLANTRLEPLTIDAPNYHALYEQFLLSYDPITRIDFGAYATPLQLASYMVAFCDWIARARFDRPGLWESRNKIIDPCCGTGTFLEAVVCTIPKLGKTYKPPIIAGFEILAAPYALAKYRMTLLHAKGVPGTDSVEIVLCNTLSDPIVDSTITDMPAAGPTVARLLLQAERNEAVNLSTPPITAVIGNPPSSDAGLHINPHTHRRILQLLEDFRPPIELRTTRQNVQKQMQNDFVKFLRWACHKLPEAEPCILAFVLPSSFLKNVSYATAREWLVKHFRWIWVMEFDQDGRTGVRTSNLFPTLQGRSVVFCARTRIGEPDAEVKYRSLLKSDRSSKVLFFSNETASISSGHEVEMDRDFVLVDMSSTRFKFQPRLTYEKDLYESFWPICSDGNHATVGKRYVFLRHSSGVKLGITAALVHVDERILLRRARAIGDLEATYEMLVRDWFRGQRKPPPRSSLNPAIRQTIAEASVGNTGAQHISRYAFRPFCTLNAFLPIELLRQLAHAGGGGARYRPELLAAYSSRGNFGIAVAPAPEDIGDSLHRFSSFAWALPDNDLCSRGNAHAFCLQYPEYLKAKAGSKWDSTPKLNISEDLLVSMGGKPGDPETAQKIIFYVYAVLCSNTYLDRFEGALYQTAGEWPRIPFPQDLKAFNRLADLGKKLAECERDDSPLLPKPDPEVLSAFPDNEVDFTGFEIDDKASTVIATDSCGTKYCIPIPQRNILSCEISGYRVIREWLKWRSGPYLRRKFSKEDAVLFAGLVAAIQRQFELTAIIDEQLVDLLSTPSLLLPV